MASTGFPSTHTTTTTTSTSVPDDRKLYMNTGFVRTEHGIVKVVQIVVCLLAFICVMSARFPLNRLPASNFISFVTVTGMLVSGILLFLFFINAVVYFSMIRWVLCELVYTATWTFFCFVAAIVATDFAAKYPSLGDPFAASAFFLFLGMCVYGYYAFKLFLLHRQGVRLVVVTTETTTITRSVAA